jgi:hypothetical protein
LEAKNMLIVTRIKTEKKNLPNVISFQKNHSKWVVQEKAQNYKQAIEKQKKAYQQRVVQETVEVVQGVEGSARNGKKVVQETENTLPFLAPTKYTNTKENIQKKKDYTPLFEEFWKTYPQRNGSKGDKAVTLERFLKLSPEEQAQAIKAASAYSLSGEIPCDAERFFKSKEYPNGRWRGWVDREISNPQGMSQGAANALSWAERRKNGQQ